MNRGITIAALVVLQISLLAGAADLAALCADRAAVERVYHEHRLGTKQPFEQTMPREMIERLVRLDLQKEAVLSKVYGVAVTPVMLAAEAQRINTTTRAPEMLAEVKHALGDDAARFDETFAKPILVERELHRLFENDGKLHASQRREAELARASMLARQPVSGARDVTWQLAPRPVQDAPAPSVAASPTKISASSNAYTNEATAQIAQVIASPGGAAAAGNENLYFEDLDPELQQVLRVQLQKPGDVSAVIETPGGFLVFQTKARTTETLAVTSLSIPKRGYDEWLASQPD